MIMTALRAALILFSDEQPTNLILRSAQRVSKDRNAHLACRPSFETPRFARLLRMRLAVQLQAFMAARSAVMTRHSRRSNLRHGGAPPAMTSGYTDMESGLEQLT